MRFTKGQRVQVKPNFNDEMDPESPAHWAVRDYLLGEKGTITETHRDGSGAVNVIVKMDTDKASTSLCFSKAHLTHIQS